MGIEQFHETFYMINRRTKMLNPSWTRPVSFNEACNIGTKQLKPQCICNGNGSTVEDLIFRNEPLRIAVHNFKYYSLDPSDSVRLINLVWLHACISAFVFSLRRGVCWNTRRESKRHLYSESINTRFCLLQRHRSVLRFRKALSILLDIYSMQ